MDEATRDQQAAAHAAAELADLRGAPVAEQGDPELAVDRLTANRRRHAVEMREDLEVLLDGQREVEVVELRDHAHLEA